MGWSDSNDDSSTDQSQSDSDPYAASTDPYSVPQANTEDAFRTDFASSNTNVDAAVFGAFDREAGSESKPPQMPSVPATGDVPLLAEVPEGEVKPTVALCGVIGVANFIRGGMLGCSFGAITGGMGGFQGGLRGKGLMVHTAASSLTTGVQFGSYLGVYSGVRCTMQVVREKKDMLNVAIAGAVAGSVGSLRTGKPHLIIGNAIAGGCLMCVVESFG